MPEKELSTEDQMAVFAALLELQDQGVRVADSREKVARRFKVEVRQVIAVEEEGLDQGWPPL